MLLRVRSPSGTHRVEVNETSTLLAFKKQIAELANVPAQDQYVSRDPSGAEIFLDDSKTLKSLNLKHGDMLYLITESKPSKGKQPATPAVYDSRSNSNSNSNTQEPSKPAAAAPKCTHGPHMKCVRCLGAETPAATPTTTTASATPTPTSTTPASNCRHGPNATCANCMTSTSTGKKIPWLCNHPPGGKCVNCIRISKTKKVANKCNHPDNMVCPNCTTSTSDAPPTDRCNHGKNGACANCRPVVEEEELATRCRNHGPNGSCIECISREERKKMKIKAQPNAHCTAAVVDLLSVNTFQLYLHRKQFSIQRVGLMYGKFAEDGTAVIDAIYEPPQNSSKTGAVFLADPDAERVDAVAALLGLQMVGWIFSHASRKYVLSSSEIVKAAELQNKYGPKFVTLVVSINEKKEGNVEAFQVSDQALKLQRDSMFLESPDPAQCLVKQPVIVEGADTTKVDNNFFLATVPVRQQPKPNIFTTEFPVENRQPPQQQSDLKVHMAHVAKKPFLDQISDFHLILWLAKVGYFDVHTDIPALCEAVKTRNGSNLEGFKIILDSIVNQ